ncbi:unnamed protein product [Sympodiomycopsis kandeliae]
MADTDIATPTSDEMISPAGHAGPVKGFNATPLEATSPFKLPTSPSKLPSSPPLISTSPNENLSPSRKAILDRFNKITTMGPPIAQPDFSGSQPSTSPVRSQSRQSPFKKALMNSQRGNTDSADHKSDPISSANDRLAPSSAKQRSSTNADLSMSLNLSSMRLSANTSLDYDLMGAPDDSFLAQAKQMGDDSFEKKLMSQCSPSKTGSKASSSRLSSSPGKRVDPRIHHSNSPSSSSPRVKPQKDNALGIGLGSPSKLSNGKANTTQDKTRSFSLTSDTSNIFDEQGEESLLYASMRIKAKPGARGGKQQKLLEALAEGREEDAMALSAASSEVKEEVMLPPMSATSRANTFKSPPPPSAMRTTTTTKPAIGRPSISKSVQSAQQATGSPRPRTLLSSSVPRPRTTEEVARKAQPTPRTAAAATPNTVTRAPASSARPPLATPSSSSTVRRAVPSTTPRISRSNVGGPSSTATPSSTSSSARPTTTAPSSTPRSRPPLNASATRMRRLSALPQLVDEQGKPKPPSVASPASRARTSAAPASTTQRSPTRPTSLAAPRTIGRPSIGGAGPARTQPSAMTSAHRTQDSPKKVVHRTADKDVALSGQLHRRTSSIPASATGSGAMAPPGSAKRAARPFLLGQGTNHTVNGNSPETRAAELPQQSPTQRAKTTTASSPRRIPPVGRKSIATSTMANARGASVDGMATRMGISKSASTSQVAGVGMTPSRLAAPVARTNIGTGLPRPSIGGGAVRNQ